MSEPDVIRLLLARRDNYDISHIARVKGRIYHLVMADQHYNAVVLPSSFDYYQRRYHLAKVPPTMCICLIHDTVLTIPCLSLLKGNFAHAYDLPEQITDVESQRKSPLGSRVLLGMYLCGMRVAQEMVADLPTTTRKRYIRRAQALGKRTQGRPVATLSPVQTGGTI
jgi:hypothetical protein